MITMIGLQRQRGARPVSDQGVVVEHHAPTPTESLAWAAPAHDPPHVDLVPARETGIGNLGDVSAALQPISDGCPGVVGNRMGLAPFW
jgi:hypothetical protein